MPTPAERQALLFLAAVAALGGGVRVVETRRFNAQAAAGEQRVSSRPPWTLGERALADQIAAVDSAREAAQETARTRRSKGRRPRGTAGSRSADAARGTMPELQPAARPMVVDLNQATARELERLPRVGPALAARIVAWREAHGPIRSLEDLRHVRGIGPVTAALLAPSVTF